MNKQNILLLYAQEKLKATLIPVMDWLLHLPHLLRLGVTAV